MPFDATVESKYFLDALELFHETQWLYEYPVTEILIRKSLEEFPEGWLTNLMMLDNSELNELVVNRITKVCKDVCSKRLTFFYWKFFKFKLKFFFNYKICKKN